MGTTDVKPNAETKLRKVGKRLFKRVSQTSIGSALPSRKTRGGSLGSPRQAAEEDSQSNGSGQDVMQTPKTSFEGSPQLHSTIFCTMKDKTGATGQEYSQGMPSHLLPLPSAKLDTATSSSFAQGIETKNIRTHPDSETEHIKATSAAPRRDAAFESTARVKQEKPESQRLVNGKEQENKADVRNVGDLADISQQSSPTAVFNNHSVSGASSGQVLHADSVPLVNTSPDNDTIANPKEVLPSSLPTLTPLQQLVVDYASETQTALQDICLLAHKIALQHTLGKMGPLLTAGLAEKSPTFRPPPSKLTSGLSYILKSESRQEGVESTFSPLPHTAIRPPGLRELSAVDHPCVTAVTQVLARSPTTATVMQCKSDNAVKSYFLHPEERGRIMEANSGMAQVVDGGQALPSLLSDRAFVCLHYGLHTRNGNPFVVLEPCLPQADEMRGKKISISGAKDDSDGDSDEIVHGERGSLLNACAASDVQLGILIKKGVGGTCPFRAAAKRQPIQQIVASMLDGLPVLEIEKEDDNLKVCSTMVAPPFPGHDSSSDRSAVDGGMDTPRSCNDADVGSKDKQLGSNEVPHAVPQARCSLVSGEVRRGNAVFPSEGHGQQRLNFQTLSCRMELYVDKKKFDELGRIALEILHTAVRRLETELVEIFHRHSLNVVIDCCQNLQAVVGSDALDDPLAAKLLPLLPSIGDTSCGLPASHHDAHAALAFPSGNNGKEDESPAQVHTRSPSYDSAREYAKESKPSLQPTPTTPAPSPRLPPGAVSGEPYGLPDDVYMVPIRVPGQPMPIMIPMRLKPSSKHHSSPQDAPPSDRCNPGGIVPAQNSQNHPISASPDSPAFAGLESQSRFPEKEEHDPVDLATLVVLCHACLLAASTCEYACRAVKMPWPLYFIGTRDHFVYDLLPIRTLLASPDGRNIRQTRWFFKPGQVPDNYIAVQSRSNKTRLTSLISSSVEDSILSIVDELIDAVSQSVGALRDLAGPPSSALLSLANDPHSTEVAADNPLYAEDLVPVGVTTYENVYSPDELAEIESQSDKVDKARADGRLPSTCYHTSTSISGGLRRTKYFFGARYLWNREQLSQVDAGFARGVRVDVPPLQRWMHSLVEAPLLNANIVPPDYVDSLALNMYHDGSEGIQSHYDDADRFQQPIYSIRLFSDSRLSFGGQLFGYTNGSFFIPMPRGCVTVMEAKSYAANGLKHCVRPCDMTGKSAGMILRRIQPQARKKAEKYFLEESMTWMRCLTLGEASIRPDPLTQGIMTMQTVPGKAHRGSPGKGKASMRSTPQELEQHRHHADAIAAALALSCIVRRVEAAEHLGIDFHTQESASIYGVLDDIAAFCERTGSPSAVPQQRQRQRHGVGVGVPAALGSTNAKAGTFKNTVHWTEECNELQAEEEHDEQKATREHKVDPGNKVSRSTVPPHVSDTAVELQPTTIQQRSLASPSKSNLSDMPKIRTPAKRTATPSSAHRNFVQQSDASTLPIKRARTSDDVLHAHSSKKKKASSTKPSSSRAAPLLCFGCLEGVDPGHGDLPKWIWTCHGGCHRTYHTACVPPTTHAVAIGAMCSDCSNLTHKCLLCDVLVRSSSSSLTVCGHRGCTQRYHRECLLSHPLTHALPSGRHTRCPLHYCAACGLCADGMPSIACALCCTAYHVRCRPVGSRVLSKTYCLCPKHEDK